jgi:hypothetical protein
VPPPPARVSCASVTFEPGAAKRPLSRLLEDKKCAESRCRSLGVFDARSVAWNPARLPEDPTMIDVCVRVA